MVLLLFDRLQLGLKSILLTIVKSILNCLRATEKLHSQSSISQGCRFSALPIKLKTFRGCRGIPLHSHCYATTPDERLRGTGASAQSQPSISVELPIKITFDLFCRARKRMQLCFQIFEIVKPYTCLNLSFKRTQSTSSHFISLCTPIAEHDRKCNQAP